MNYEQVLSSHFEYFLNIFSRVPSQYLEVSNSDDEEDRYLPGSKYYHNKSAENQSAKFLLKQAAAKHAKRAKYDPAQNQGTFMTGESILTSDSGVSSRGKLQERLKELCDRRRNGLAHSDKNTAAASLKVKERRQAKEKAKLDAKKKGVALSKKTGDSAGTQKKTAGGPFKADGKLIFSKFDLGVNERDKKKRNLSILGGGGNSKSSSSIMGKALSMPSDPKQALAKLEARQLKLHKLTQENPEKAHQKGIDLEWKKAVALASGEKIKDDERLLKKSLKKRQAQKAKSSVAWKDRLDKEKIQQKKSIKKRAENIANRKKRPGFEGKAFSSKKSRK